MYGANYDGGSFGVWEIISNDGKLSDNPIAFYKVTFNGSNVNKDRQEKSHPHCIYPHPCDSTHFYVTD